MPDGQREYDWPTQRGRYTRARIVDAAADLFARHGVAGTSVEDVRRAAGVSGSQITHYFQGKQGLVRAVISRQADVAALSLTGPGPGRFRSLPDLYAWADAASAPQGPACRIGALAGELVQPDPLTQAELSRGFRRWAAAVRGALERLQGHWVLRQDADCAALAYALMAALHGGTLVNRAVQTTAPLDGAVGVVLAYIASLCTVAPTAEGGCGDTP
jgi:TetR/AcrR family transcriptional regulator, transcriptional repressor for nem operon